MSKKTIAIIPAAGKGSRMSSLTDKFPKAMLPLNNKDLAIDLIISNLVKNKITDIIIVGGYHHDKLFSYVREKYLSYKNLSIHLVKQNNLDGLPGAIHAGLDCIETKMGSSLNKWNSFIVLGDTILDDKLSFGSSSWVGYKQLSEYDRWCLIKTDMFNNIEYIVDKPKDKPPTDKVTVGAYYFTDLNLLKQSIEAVKTQINNEFQFSDVMTEFIKHSSLSGKKIDKWYDIGEINTFKASKKNITRFFNDIKILSNSVLKESTNVSKISNEAVWYQKYPSALSKYVPRLLKSGSNFYELEYIPYDMLQEIFIYGIGNNNDVLWDSIFTQIFSCLDDMKSEFKTSFEKDVDRAQYQKFNDKMLVDKTLERISNLVNYKEFDWKSLMNSDLIINGKQYKSLFSIKDKIIAKCKEISSKMDLSIVHGDMFFGNMFYDIVNDNLKLIDPRGSWGEVGIFGDARYDLAKLNQSIIHNYDFITNEFYTLKYSGNEFEYEYFDGTYQNDVRSKFVAELKKRGVDSDLIDFMTGITFLCIVPIHSDNRRNQIMEYLTAIQILNDHLSKEKN